MATDRRRSSIEIHGHGQIDAGLHQGGRRGPDRRHAQYHRRFHHARRQVGRTPCWLGSSRWWQAQRSRAPIQRLADQVSGWFVPLVIVIAIVAFAAWMAFGPEPRFAHGLVLAVAVLIIACPCALGLATPMSIMVGVGRGAHLSVLIKNAEALEGFEKVDTLVVDKTGTLTEGKPRLTGLKPVGASRERAAAACGLAWSGRASIRSPQRLSTLRRSAAFDPGRGAGFRQPGRQGGDRDGRGPCAGDRQPPDHERSRHRHGCAGRRAEALRAEGGTVIFVAIDGRVAGLLVIADPVKQTTPKGDRGSSRAPVFGW
jgi:Cu+-exporting ATPase